MGFPQSCWQTDYGQRAKNPRYDQTEKSAYGETFSKFQYCIEFISIIT